MFHEAIQKIKVARFMDHGVDEQDICDRQH